MDAAPHSDPGAIKELLARQLTSPVQWEASMRALLGRGLGAATEVGPNKVTAGIMKRIDKAFPMDNVTV